MKWLKETVEDYKLVRGKSDEWEDDEDDDGVDREKFENVLEKMKQKMVDAMKSLKIGGRVKISVFALPADTMGFTGTYIITKVSSFRFDGIGQVEFEGEDFKNLSAETIVDEYFTPTKDIWNENIEAMDGDFSQWKDTYEIKKLA